MSKSAISRSSPDQNITHNFEVKSEPSLNFAEEKAKVLNVAYVLHPILLYMIHSPSL
jgi:hypothetical protein